MDSPAFELLQLAVVQHAPHVLVHLLQTTSHREAFPLSNNRHVSYNIAHLFAWVEWILFRSLHANTLVYNHSHNSIFCAFPYFLHLSLLMNPQLLNGQIKTRRLVFHTFLLITCLETWTVSHRMHFLFLSILWKSAHHCKNNEIWVTDRLSGPAGPAVTAPWSICSWWSKHIHVQEQIQAD